MMYWARRSKSWRSSGKTRRLRCTLNPEWSQPRSMFARSGGRRPLSTRNVMTRARNNSSSGLRLTSELAIMRVVGVGRIASRIPDF